MLSIVQCEDIVIPAGTKISNVVLADLCYGDSESFTLFAPAALDAGVYKFQVSHDGVNFVDFDALTPPAAGKAISYIKPSFYAFRIVTDTNTVGDMKFSMNKLVCL